MRFDLLIENSKVVTSTGTVHADVALKDGNVAALLYPGSGAEAADKIDAAKKLVLPGVIDAHVHFNDPGFPEREDMATGTSAAAAGGVTTVIDMPLSGNPAVTSPEALELKKQAAESRAQVNYALWGGLVNDNVDKLEEMSRAGAVAFKAFTCFAGEDFPYATPDVLYRGMKEARRLGLLIGVHCENQELTAQREADAARLKSNTVRAFLDAHSPLTEETATDMVLRMARETGARVHICHATLPSVVDAVVQARKEGADVTVETCPHYLIFTEEDLERLGAVLKCTPPVRTRKAVEGMWERVFDGSIDMIGSDHSPSTLLQKNIGAAGDFRSAWGGVQGVQTMLPALFSEGVVKRGLPLERLVELISTAPAGIFGLYPRRGNIQIGGSADLTIFDPARQWTLSPEILRHKNRHTPYMGMQFTGGVEATLVQGRLVYSACAAV